MNSSDVYIRSVVSGFCSCGKTIRIFEINGLPKFDKCEDCETPDMKIDREYANSVFRDMAIELVVTGDIE